MKKKTAIALICVLVLMILSGCGMSDAKKELISEEWVDALGEKATLKFNEDGTGTYSGGFNSGSFFSRDILWTIEGNDMSITFKEYIDMFGTIPETKKKYILEKNSQYIIKAAETNEVFAKKSSLETVKHDIRKEAEGKAFELDHNKYKIEYNENASKAVQDYNRKLVRWTTIVGGIESMGRIVGFDAKTPDLEKIEVSLPESETMNLHKGDKVTVIGTCRCGGPTDNIQLCDSFIVNG